MSRYIDVAYVRFEDVKVGDVVAYESSSDFCMFSWYVVTGIGKGFNTTRQAGRYGAPDPPPEITITLVGHYPLENDPLHLIAVQVMRQD